MDHVLVEIDPDIEDTYVGGAGAAVPIPIEAKLRSLSVRLLYEICRIQKLNAAELRASSYILVRYVIAFCVLTLCEVGLFTDSFIDSLFELVEQTRNMQDETFNYSVIKLIVRAPFTRRNSSHTADACTPQVALNEQFMVASLSPASTASPPETPKSNLFTLRGAQHRRASTPSNPPASPLADVQVQNRVVGVLIHRLGSSKTFGQNMIFMLNRASEGFSSLFEKLGSDFN